MDKKIRLFMLIGMVLILSITAFSIFSEQAYGLFGILLGIFMINLGSSWDKRKKWNKGISKLINKPWEFYDIIDYSDSSWDYHFVSRDVNKLDSLIIGPNDFIIDEYKGDEKLV